ncbi:hypothetical protein BH10CYA1_BH10CYA1_48590 [soil metagenome]
MASLTFESNDSQLLKTGNSDTKSLVSLSEMKQSVMPLRDRASSSSAVDITFDSQIYGSVFDNQTKIKDVPIVVAETPGVRMFEGLTPAVQKHFKQMEDGVTNSFNEPFAKNSGVLDRPKILYDLTLGGYLGKNTDVPPMFDDTVESAKVTRPYEQRLMRDLNSTKDPISQASLVARAMQICGDDKLLTALTLANFTKNIASVERSQAPLTDIPRTNMGYPFDTYSRQQSNDVFKRLERFDAGAPKQLSKEDATGALYHFYGAVLATAAGLGAEVHGENAIFGWQRDPIKREAGPLGATVGDRVFGTAQQFNDVVKPLF